MGSKAQPTFDVGWPDEKQLGPSEGGTVVKLNREAAQKFHEATQAGVPALLVRHDPTGGVGVIIELMLRGLLQKKCQKRSCCEKKNKRKQIRMDEASRCRHRHTASSQFVDATARGQRKDSPWWRTINSEMETVFQKRRQFLHGSASKSSQ